MPSDVGVVVRGFQTVSVAGYVFARFACGFSEQKPEELTTGIRNDPDNEIRVAVTSRLTKTARFPTDIYDKQD